MSTKPADLHASKPAAAPTLKRRGWLLGAGAAGAVAIVAKAGAPAEVAASAAAAAPEAEGGYRLTPHVLRYYQTAKA